MKYIFGLASLTAVISAQNHFDDIKACVAQKYPNPNQYTKCLTKKSCEEKLKKCAGKCGSKVNYTCWSGCIGILDTVAGNATTCTANNCMSNP